MILMDITDNRCRYFIVITYCIILRMLKRWWSRPVRWWRICKMSRISVPKLESESIGSIRPFSMGNRRRVQMTA
jgi:hypothetical protein